MLEFNASISYCKYLILLIIPFYQNLSHQYKGKIKDMLVLECKEGPKAHTMIK